MTVFAAGAAFVIAAWAIYNLGKDEQGNELTITDAMKSILNEKAQAAKKNPVVFLELTSIFASLKESDVFVETYLAAYNKIKTDGIEKSVLEINSINKN